LKIVKRVLEEQYRDPHPWLLPLIVGALFMLAGLIAVLVRR
jgi:hypothetical protein